MNEILKLFEFALNMFQVGQSPQIFLVLVGLAFARMLSFLVIVPFFGGSVVPGRVKVATATALVIISYPSLAADAPIGTTLDFGPLGFIALLMKEAFVGFTLGFVATMVFEAIQVSGRIIDAQRGASMSEMMAPQLQTKVSELGQFKLQFAIALFLFTGMHRFFLQSLMLSFEVIPALKFPHFTPGFTGMTESITLLTASVLSIGVQLATPAIIALLLTDLFFGIVNRVAPQINVFFLSMPVKMAIGLAVVMVALPLYQEQFISYFQESYTAFETLIRQMSLAFQ